jgi:hypothetical protein
VVGLLFIHTSSMYWICFVLTIVVIAMDALDGYLVLTPAVAVCSRCHSRNWVQMAGCRGPHTRRPGALLAALLLSAAGAAVARPITGSLVQCLEDRNIEVITGADYPAYVEASQTFSKLFRSWPSAIAYPNNTEEVAAAVKCAAKYNTAVRPRCGGHGNEGESVTTGALTIDLSRMSTIEMAKDADSVTVQAGARVGQ